MLSEPVDDLAASYEILGTDYRSATNNAPA